MYILSIILVLEERGGVHSLWACFDRIRYLSNTKVHPFKRNKSRYSCGYFNRYFFQFNRQFSDEPLFTSGKSSFWQYFMHFDFESVITFFDSSAKPFYRSNKRSVPNSDSFVSNLTNKFESDLFPIVILKVYATKLLSFNQSSSFYRLVIQLRQFI